MPAYLAQPVYQQTLAPIQDKAVLQTSAGAQMSLRPTGSSSRSALRPGSSATTLTPSTTSPARTGGGTPPSGYVPRMPGAGGSSTSASVSDMTDPSVPVSMPLYDPGEQAAAERGELPEYLAARDGAGSSTPRTALAVGLGFAVGISAMWLWRR